MKRREFLRTSAGLASAFVPGWTLAQSRPCAPPSVAVAGGTSANVSCGPGDAEADWEFRKTGALQATDFRDSEVALYEKGVRQPASGIGGVFRDDLYGVALTGGKCVRVNYPKEAGTEAGTWKCFLDRAWNSLDINTVQTVGMGNKAFYVQFRVRFPPSWLAPSIGTNEGKKVCIVSSNFHSNTTFEHVIQNLDNRGVVEAYHQDGQVTAVRFEEALPPYDFNLQNMIPGPNYCRWTNGATSYPNCYLFTPDTWMCLYLRIRAGTYAGTAGNEWDLWAWKPGETGYTHLHKFRDYRIGGVGSYTNGFNGLHLLPYTSKRTSSSVDSYVLYDQVIVSAAPIACPTV